MNFLTAYFIPILIGIGVIIIVLLLTYKLGSFIMRGGEEKHSVGDKIGMGFLVLFVLTVALLFCYLIGKLFLWLFPIL